MNNYLSLAVAFLFIGLSFQSKILTSETESVCHHDTCMKRHEHCEIVNGLPTCVKRCRKCNADENKPICGFDGKTYKNKCFLKEVECMEETFIGVECKGECPCDPAEVVALAPKLVHRLQKLRMKVRREQQLEKELKREAELSKIHFKKHQKIIKKKKFLINEQAKVESKLKRKIKKWHKIERKMRKNKISSKKAETAEEKLQRRITKIKSASRKSKRGKCTADKLSDLPGRLIDWFHVLRSTAIRHNKTAHPMKEMKFMDEKLRAIYVKLSCGKAANDPFDSEVMCLEPLTWMFDQLDVNKDNRLTRDEQKEFSNNEAESCLKPFLMSCDYNFNSTIERSEFCKCLCVEPSCTKAIENIPTILSDGKAMPAPGYFVPQCDEDGFFVSQQCHKDECWCVDRNGAEIKDTRSLGKTLCGDNTLTKEEAEMNMQLKLTKTD